MDRLQQIFDEWEKEDPDSVDVDKPPEASIGFDEIDVSGGSDEPEVEVVEASPMMAATTAPESMLADSETATRLRAPTSGGEKPLDAGGPAKLPESGRPGSVPSPLQHAGGPSPTAKPKSSGPDWEQLAQQLAMANSGRAQSKAYESLFANVGAQSGYRPNAHAGDVLVEGARLPLDMAKEQQGYEGRQQALDANRSAATVKAAMDDPNSLQSQKAREAIRAVLPGVALPQLDSWSANDIQRYIKTGDFARIQEGERRKGLDAEKRTADEAKAAAAKTKEGVAATETEALRREVAKIAPDADLSGLSAVDLRAIRSAKDAKDRARIMAAAQRDKEDHKDTQDVPPGYEIAPDANPGPDSRKKFTALVASQQKLKGLTAKMRAATKDKGRLSRLTDYSALNQLATQIGIEGKNVAELGALSGPDMDLMEAMVQNPTKAFNILINSDTGKNMDGLDSWADESVRAGEKAYGLQRRGGDPATPPIPEAGGKVTPRGKPYARKQQNPATGAFRYLDENGKVVE